MPAESTTKAGHTSISGRHAGMERQRHHPNRHTETELKLIRNPTLGMVELWHRLCKRGYARRPESLFRVMRKLGMFPQPKARTPYKAKPYEQMQYPGRRVQVDMKGAPLKCLAYPEQSTYSSADFLEKRTAWFKRRGVQVACVQTDNGFAFTNRFSNSKKDLPTHFALPAARLGIRHKRIRPYTPRHNGKVERSHREGQKRFCDSHRFFSLADFSVRLAAHPNRLPGFLLKKNFFLFFSLFKIFDKPTQKVPNE